MSEHQNPQLRSWSDAPLSAYAAPEPTAFVDGPFGSDLKVSDYTESGVRILQLQNLGDGYFIDDNVKYASERKALSLSRCLVRPGDLLIAKMADPLARACIVPSHLEKGLIVADLIKLRLDREHDATFICSAINGTEFRREAERLATGTTRTRISLSTLKRIGLRAPKPKEQRRIGDLVRVVDKTIQQTEALIAKYQQIKAGLMHDLFTRGVTPDGRLRPSCSQAPHLYKDSPLGWIPKEWEVVRIADAFEVQLGKMLNKFAKTGKLSAPYLGNRAVQWDFVDISAMEVMDFSAYERQKFSLLPGDLLVCEGGDVGRTAMWRGEMDGCYYQKAIHRLRPKSADVLPAFMLRFMRFARDNGSFREFTSQSSIAHLTQEKLGSIGRLLPSLDEQKKIADRLDSLDGFIQTEQAKLAKLRQQKHGLMHDLLTGRVGVKVV